MFRERKKEKNKRQYRKKCIKKKYDKQIKL
jgi:hypothetical protein